MMYIITNLHMSKTRISNIPNIPNITSNILFENQRSCRIIFEISNILNSSTCSHIKRLQPTGTYGFFFFLKKKKKNRSRKKEKLSNFGSIISKGVMLCGV
jgi:hypothetical protein